MMTAIAPPPPSPFRGRRRPWLIAGGVVVLILCLVGVAMAFRDGHSSSAGATSTSQPRTVSYSIALHLSSSEYAFHTCDGDHGGYDDIHDGAQVEVTDGLGKLLGVGDLFQTDGGPIGPTCTYAASISVEKSSDGFYRVTSGNNNRGYLTYKEADFKNNTLTVKASLGN
jgi:hypothetical protein